MHTVVLQSKPRKTARGSIYTIGVVGNSPAKEAVMRSIKDLETHPLRRPSAR